MGFFDFLKKKKEEETVKFNEVESWITRYLENKNLDKKISQFKEEMNHKIEEAKELLTALDKAGLLNENIPDRVKHIMEGNRNNYIQKITLFLDDIRIPDNYLQIREFSKKLTDDMDRLSKETQKSYFVLKEFLETELVAVAKKIKEMENEAIKFRQKIEKENLHKLEEIKEKLVDYENSEQTLSELKNLKEEQGKELQELKNKEKTIDKRISELKNAKSYKEYNELKKERERILEDIQRQKKEIITHFSTLEKAFKKYKRMSLNEALIDKYLKDPTQALLADENLGISEVLGKMLLSLDKLELKDKKAEKTKEEIGKLSKDLLTKIKEDLHSLYEKEKKNKNILLANTSAMNISEQETWLENTKHKIKGQEQAIEETEHKIERVNPRLIKQQVRDILKEFSVTMKNA
ncbi:MAG: hypothetical protein ISS25_00860 [Nanoarchaeota archaeon]|nr:hypothetical protein [DPANN group archaeon]MBL7116366.1 hypothetical protein [Nanoarchaeota archaeon]